MNLKREVVASNLKSELEKCVMRLLRHVDNDDEFLMPAGSRFHTDGSADRKARASTTAFVRVTGNGS